VGQVWGGTSINAIAEEAGFNLDLRSVDGGVLEQLAREARRAVLRAARRHGCAVELNPVGDRPAAAVDNAVLVTAARRALESAGVPARVVASSTDANAAMAAGLPAIAFGVYRGGDAHRACEWLEPGSLVPGYRALLALLAELARE
jgi:acetylornithine deacetylase/succinyl-diaminopimelate desuccinylase-like protein